MRSAIGGQERDRVEVLPDEVAGVEVQPERGPVVDRLQRALAWSRSRRRSRSGAPRARTARPPRRTRRGSGSSGRRSRRNPRSIIDVGHGREHRHRVPDRRAGEPDHRAHAERGRGAGGVGHLRGRPAPDAFGLAVAPDAGRQDAPMALVDRVVAHGLADQVVGDRPAAQPVLAPAARAARPGSRARSARGPPRSGRPSRPARGRRSPTAGQLADLAPAAGRPTGR